MWYIKLRHSKCTTYIDLNMVRAGVVKHQTVWTMSGYNKRQNPPDRYALIDTKKLMELCGLINKDQMRNNYKQWVEDTINIDNYKKDLKQDRNIASYHERLIESWKYSPPPTTTHL